MSAIDRIELPQDQPGRHIYRADLVATVVFVVAAALATAAPGALRVPYAVLSSVLFAAGCVAFLWAYLVSLGRSRNETISVVGIYGLAGSAPAPVRGRFHALTALQTVVAITAAAIHPFSAQAFGILVPMLGLGLGGLWAARHGRFGPRQDPRRPHAPTKESGIHG